MVDVIGLYVITFIPGHYTDCNVSYDQGIGQLMLVTILLGLASYAAAGGFTAPSPYAASVYGPSIGSVGYGYGGRGFLPQAYNLQVRFGGGVKAGVAYGGYGHGGYGLAVGGYGHGVALGHGGYGHGLALGYGGYGHGLALGYGGYGHGLGYGKLYG
ncbi:hypothetical protein HPB49_016293 [Dermacentor silvarum]|uniref:Uncharacterized protein n=1 Tax=Dermacentor silvarum TaxID=543639 RepID=A0ACB8CS16_DERSI|nr:hypothetical protein HPB49_016293 [Dermacentor silvarum]